RRISMELKDFRKLINKIPGAKVKKETFSFGTVVSVLINGKIGNVYSKDDIPVINKVKKVVLENEINEITIDGERVICSFIKGV
ncbi:MAG: hypothetical protein M0P94_04940, partial [Candidatus Absconditabacterales bacterium]|nr:hypothetical protein [Candidatus Absconditabacterales bacterium]